MIDMASASGTVLDTLQSIQDRGGIWWWLDLRICRICGQGWLVAQEERQNDVYCLRRLSEDIVRAIVAGGPWPSDFDHYETLLAMGKAEGYAYTFFNVEDSSLINTITLLAEQRPGIRVSEIAPLLNVSEALAKTLAVRAAAASGVQIDFTLVEEN